MVARAKNAGKKQHPKRYGDFQVLRHEDEDGTLHVWAELVIESVKGSSLLSQTDRLTAKVNKARLFSFLEDWVRADLRRKCAEFVYDGTAPRRSLSVGEAVAVELMRNKKTRGFKKKVAEMRTAPRASRPRRAK